MFLVSRIINALLSSYVTWVRARYGFGYSGTVMQSQLVCSGCRTLLLYPRGATNVRCAMCNTITSVPPPGMDMSQLVCAGCRTLLMYPRGAASVRCSCCNTVNLGRETNQVAHVECGRCRTTLMYPYGAPSVKCAVCHFITNIGSTSQTHNQTVVIENPMSMDESGKLRNPELSVKLRVLQSGVGYRCLTAKAIVFVLVVPGDDDQTLICVEYGV
ncbi:LOL2 protein [Nymphaea thermarum]|nr:LOL2 protein [Nymphaea thermarum]